MFVTALTKLTSDVWVVRRNRRLPITTHSWIAKGDLCPQQGLVAMCVSVFPNKSKLGGFLLLL